MGAGTVDELVRWLEGDPNCRLEDGLRPAEVERAERVLEIAIPPLWRDVLLRASPIPLANGDPLCPGLREPDSPDTRRWVEAPVEGLALTPVSSGARPPRTGRR